MEISAYPRAASERGTDGIDVDVFTIITILLGTLRSKNRTQRTILRPMPHFNLIVVLLGDAPIAKSEALSEAICDGETGLQTPLETTSTGQCGVAGAWFRA